MAVATNKNYVLVIMTSITVLLTTTIDLATGTTTLYESPAFTLTTTTKPPVAATAQAIQSALLRAARLKYGGEVPVEISRDLPGEKQGENTCTRRSVRKYLGNPERNCTSLRPYPVTWCEGVCFPQKDVSKRGPLANFQKYLERNQKRYKCVADRKVKRKVRIFCEDDQQVTVYRIEVIKSCKCKQVERNDVSTTDNSNNNNNDNNDGSDHSKNDNNNNNGSTKNENDSMSVGDRARRFGKLLHKMQNKLMAMKVQ